MIVEVFELPDVRNCKRLPHFLFRGEPRRVIRVFRGNVAGFGFTSDNFHWKPDGLKPVYRYPAPARTGHGVGAIMKARVLATRDKPEIEIWSDDGFAVELNGRIVYNDWHGHGVRHFRVHLPMKKFNVAELKIYWFDFCWGGAFFCRGHGLAEIGHAVEGSAVGAVLGAVVGYLGGEYKGAAVGAAVGAALGGLIGYIVG